MSGVRCSLVLPAAVLAFATVLPAESPEKDPVDQLIPWLLRENGELREIPFSKVIVDATGKRVFAIDPKNEADQRAVKCISTVLDEVVKRMNAADSPVQNLARINEASSHFEDLLRELLNRMPGFSCDFPRTSNDRV
jgi:hypothetical protein